MKSSPLLCSCTGTTEQQLKSLLERLPRQKQTLAEVQKQSDLSTLCGKCRLPVQVFISQYHNKTKD